MERRTFVGGGAAALTTLAATACGTSRGTDAKNADAKAPDAEAPGAKAPVSKATSADWSALAEDLDGTLVRAGDEQWSTARQLYNTRYDTLKPTAIAYVAHPDDIRTTLAYARAHGIKASIRNGGHSYAGWSSGNGRLVIDVSELNKIDASTDEVVVGAGAKLIDVYRTLAAQSVTIPAGTCPTVGVSGLTLGGGHGVTSRAYGLTCDSLTQATLITADGKQLIANDTKNKDLFWALRGAGNGNFGVVTELRFKTHPATEGVTARVTWPWSQAAAVMEAWQEWGPTQPDEIWSACNLENGGSPTVAVSAFSLGTSGDLENALDVLAGNVGTPPDSSSVEPRSYGDAMESYAGCSSYSAEDQCRLPGSTPGRAPEGALGRETYAARSDFYDRAISPAGIQTLLTQITGITGGAASIAFTALGGQVNRVSPTDTAFVHRNSLMLAQYLASWKPDTPGEEAQSWLDTTHKSMTRHASGAAYQNYTDPTLTNWKEAYYGDAVPRLTALKKKYDPERFFTFPQAL